ncbi:MAG: glycosyltransferase family 2 protein [Bacteroidales bacterium]|nr:glycosyltransferase family 2 protein [Bacteroidales bacterium]
METAVCLINYNAYQDTLACVESLRCQHCYIVVVDNCSTNDSVAQLTNAWGNDVVVWHLEQKNFVLQTPLKENVSIHLVVSDTNGGFAYGNNVLLTFVKLHLSAKYILWLNNDTVVPENFIDVLQNEIAATNTERVALAVEERNYYTKSYRHSGFHYLNLLTGLAFPRRVMPSHKYICGACLFTSVNAPTWNENYFLYYEDADYAMRLKSAGYKMVATKQTYYLHKQGVSTGQHPETIFKSMCLFYRTHFPHLLPIARCLRSLQYKLNGNKKALDALIKCYDTAR